MRYIRYKQINIGTTFLNLLLTSRTVIFSLRVEPGVVRGAAGMAAIVISSLAKSLSITRIDPPSASDQDGLAGGARRSHNATVWSMEPVKKRKGSLVRRTVLTGALWTPTRRVVVEDSKSHNTTDLSADAQNTPFPSYSLASTVSIVIMNFARARKDTDVSHVSRTGPD